MTTAADMYTYVREALNKGHAATLAPVEFDVLINAAIMRYVRKAIKDAEKDQRSLDVLRVLIPPPVVVPNTGQNQREEEVFSLPYVHNPVLPASHGYLHMLNCAFRMRKVSDGTPVDCGSEDGWAGARPMPRDARHEWARDPFWEPSDEEPYWYLSGNDLKAIGGTGSYASQARMEYLRHPSRVSVVNGWQPELPSHVNNEIADLAVRRQIEIIENPRYRTQLAEEQVVAQPNN